LPQNGPIISFEHFSPASNCCFKHSRNAFFAAQLNASGGTDSDAGRLLIFRQSVLAQVTFDRDLILLFKLHGVKGAGFYAFSASDAGILIDQYDALIVSGNGIDRAGFRTGCPGAVMTIHRDKVRAIFNYFY
jgi:hypothetical protein